MTTIEFYDRLIINDDTEDWNLLDSHLFGYDFDDDLDNRIFNNWEK